MDPKDMASDEARVIPPEQEATADAKDEQPWANRGEVVSYFKETRDLRKTVGELAGALDGVLTRLSEVTTPQAPKNSKAATEAPPGVTQADFQRELDFRDKLLESKLGGRELAIVKRLYQAERTGINNVSDWFEKVTKEFGADAQSTEDVTQLMETERLKSPNVPAPARKTDANLPTDPIVFMREYPDEWMKLKPEERIGMFSQGAQGARQLQRIFSKKKR